MTIVAILAGIWFLFLAVHVWSYTRSMRYLREVRIPRKDIWPKVSLVVPACNEAQTIGPAALSLLQMDYPELELVFVNDRSTDETGLVLAEVARRDPRVKVVEVRELPDGWLGKVHALHQGAQCATGEWLLFSDADIHYGHQSLKKAVVYTEENGIDFLAVGPDFLSPTLPLRVMVGQFLHLISFGFSYRRLADPGKPDAYGAGVFGLVRRKAYENSEGFPGIRLDVIDDGALAWLLKRAGAKLGFLNGLGELRVEWYPSLRAMVRGIEKNGFALYQYSWPAILAFSSAVWGIWVFTLVAPLFAPAAPQVFWAFSLAVYLASAGRSFRKTMNLHPCLALTLPISFPLFPLIALRSAVYCWKRGGIHWRDTFYPLALLRRGQRLRMIDSLLKREGGAG